MDQKIILPPIWGIMNCDEVDEFLMDKGVEKNKRGRLAAKLANKVSPKYFFKLFQSHIAQGKDAERELSRVLTNTLMGDFGHVPTPRVLPLKDVTDEIGLAGLAGSWDFPRAVPNLMYGTASQNVIRERVSDFVSDLQEERPNGNGILYPPDGITEVVSYDTLLERGIIVPPDTPASDLFSILAAHIHRHQFKRLDGWVHRVSINPVQGLNRRIAVGDIKYMLGHPQCSLVYTHVLKGLLGTLTTKQEVEK